MRIILSGEARIQDRSSGRLACEMSAVGLVVGFYRNKRLGARLYHLPMSAAATQLHSITPAPAGLHSESRGSQRYRCTKLPASVWDWDPCLTLICLGLSSRCQARRMRSAPRCHLKSVECAKYIIELGGASVQCRANCSACYSRPRVQVVCWRHTHSRSKVGRVIRLSVVRNQ